MPFTTSGVRVFNLDVAEIIEEAYERCGLEVRTGYDMRTAKRSMNLMFADWANRGLNMWTIKEGTINLNVNQETYSVSASQSDILEGIIRTFRNLTTLSADITNIATAVTVGDVSSITVDDVIRIEHEQMTVTAINTTTKVLTVTRASNSTTAVAHTAAVGGVSTRIFLTSSVAITGVTSDLPVSRVSRTEYLAIPSKTTNGRPTQFYYNRQTTPTVSLWPSPDDATQVFVYNYVDRIEDAKDLANIADAPYRFLPCLVAGVAYYVSMKKAPDRIQLLKSVYEEEFQRAADEDTNRVSLKLQPSISYLRVN